MQSILTAEVAEKFLADEYGVHLEDFQFLADDAAVILARHHVGDDPFSPSLDLSGLQSLSEESATALSRYEGPSLRLSGLRQLSPQIAAILATFRGSLVLDGLEELTPETGKSLSTHGCYLSLRGLRSLDEDSAKALSTHGSLVSLRIPRISQEVGRILATYPSIEIFLTSSEENSEPQYGDPNRIRVCLEIHGYKNAWIVLGECFLSEYPDLFRTVHQFAKDLGFE